MMQGAVYHLPFSPFCKQAKQLRSFRLRRSYPLFRVEQ